MPLTAHAAPHRLQAHLASWLGAWPPDQPLQVVAAPQRDVPGWDGALHPALGVAAPDAGALLSVSPAAAHAVRQAAAEDLTGLLARLPALLRTPQRGTYLAVFRWTLEPADLPDAGLWISSGSADTPAWLRPFGGQVLLARDADGRYLGGVGVKRHDRFGHELAVVIDPAARGRGLGRRLVAQAARRVLRDGAVPTYLHDPANTASGRVADAAGFPDRGWTSFGLSEVPRADGPVRQRAAFGEAAGRAPGRSAERGGRRTGPEVGRDRGRLCGPAAGGDRHRAGAHRARQEPHRPLQGAAVGALRPAAEDRHREDPEVRAAGAAARLTVPRPGTAGRCSRMAQ